MKALTNIKILLTSIILSSAGYSDFVVCNKSKSDTTNVAFGYHKDGKITSSGWYVLQKNTCGIVYEGDLTELDSNLFYVYAFSSDNKMEWKGNVKLCTKLPGPFEYKNAAKKCKSGEFKKFKKFTSDDQEDFAIKLGNQKGKGIISFEDTPSFDSFIAIRDEVFLD